MNLWSLGENSSNVSCHLGTMHGVSHADGTADRDPQWSMVGKRAWVHVGI